MKVTFETKRARDLGEDDGVFLPEEGWVFVESADWNGVRSRFLITHSNGKEFACSSDLELRVVSSETGLEIKSELGLCNYGALCPGNSFIRLDENDGLIHTVKSIFWENQIELTLQDGSKITGKPSTKVLYFTCDESPVLGIIKKYQSLSRDAASYAQSMQRWAERIKEMTHSVGSNPDSVVDFVRRSAQIADAVQGSSEAFHKDVLEASAHMLPLDVSTKYKNK